MGRRKKPSRKWWQLVGHAAAMLRTREGRIQLGLYAGLVLITITVPGIIDRSMFTPLEITPAAARFGWDEATAKVEAPLVAAMMPKFAITDGDGNVMSGEGKSAELWKFAKAVNGGKHIATWRQESGDCVSMGATNAEAYRMAVQIAKEQRNEVLKIPFPPYTYGGSRVIIGHGQLGRSAGSVGAWAAQFAQSHGIYTVDQATADGFSYSGRLADQWGQTGPPKKTIEFGRKFRIRTVSQIRSWPDLRDALVHGFPVTVASNVGFNGGAYDRDGKRFLRAQGSWPHQMCFIGVDDRPSHDKCVYCLNSWGPDAHPKPLNDEPPGGFWVSAQDATRMIAQGDSWAFSDFDGFPASDDVGADWNAFKLEATSPKDVELVARAEQPEPQPVLKEVRQMFPLELLIPLCMLGIILFAGCLVEKYSKNAGTIGALLIACSLIGMSDRAEAGYRHRMARRQQMVSSQCSTCPQGVCANGQCGTTNCANGSCPTGYQKPSDKPANPASGLPKDMIPGVQVASTEKVPDVFNAFGPVESTQVWTAFPPPTKALRRYADCYEHEKEFVLVIGKETEARAELDRSNKPVAFEIAHQQIKPGAYRVFEHAGHLAFEPLHKAADVSVSSVRIRKQR